MNNDISTTKPKPAFKKTNEISNFWENKVEEAGKEQNIKEWKKNNSWYITLWSKQPPNLNAKG